MYAVLAHGHDGTVPLSLATSCMKPEARELPTLRSAYLGDATLLNGHHR